MFLGDLASRQVYPGAPVELMLVHDGRQLGENRRLCRRFRDTLAELARDSLLFSPVAPGRESLPALPLSGLAEHCRTAGTGDVPVLTRARCVFECGESGLAGRFDDMRRKILDDCGRDASLIARLLEPVAGASGPGVPGYAGMRGGLDDVERAARLLQLTGSDRSEPAPTAAGVLEAAGSGSLAEAAAMWRSLQGVMRLVGEEGFDVSAAGQGVRSVVAVACGFADFDELGSAVAGTASRASSEIDAVLARG